MTRAALSAVFSRLHRIYVGGTAVELGQPTVSLDCAAAALSGLLLTQVM